MGKDPRYEVVYEIYSYQHGCHLRLKTGISESEREAISVVDLWPTANWHEREAYDMLGVTFKGHPDMRRILMWEGYPYYPLRKDFPLERKLLVIKIFILLGLAASWRKRKRNRSQRKPHQWSRLSHDNFW